MEGVSHDIFIGTELPETNHMGLFAINFFGTYCTIKGDGITLNFPLGVVSTDQITAIQEAYWSMASALSEADGIDYTDPEELELLIATLIDLDAMDGKSSVSLLAECSSSPDVNTRQALANALAAAPSMWTLGNAGMGALQVQDASSGHEIRRESIREGVHPDSTSDQEIEHAPVLTKPSS